MVRTPIVVLAMLMALPQMAWGQVTFKRCLTDGEVMVEQLVRHGVFLREAGNRCEEWVQGTSKKWRAIDQRFGPRLKKQTDARAKLFAREFKEDALKVRTYFDGRLVTYFRNVPLTQAYCTHADEMLDDITKGGWGAFTTQAKIVQNEVLLDYKKCQ
ncbi:MAG TPA: hypothetical protein VL974_13535 [Magnetospirillum sp.]|nr:hypothetical protein [Magnetospirillum sp.]